MTEDFYFQSTNNNVIHLYDAVDAEGNFSNKAADDMIGCLFEDDECKPIPHMVAYHKESSCILELSHPNPDSVNVIDDLNPIIIFPTSEDLIKYIKNKHVMYKSHNGAYDAAGALRMIHIGTHLPFVKSVQMQQERLSRLELHHIDEKFNIICSIKEKNIGKKIKDIYYQNENNDFAWITAGGHGDVEDVDDI
eukprot:gene8214-11114_t